MDSLINKKNILILVYLYLLIGILIICLGYKLNKIYIFLILFICFKWLFNYRKCTFSRIECIIRRVKKEKGYLYNFLEIITDLRYTNHIINFIKMVLIILFFHFIIYKNTIYIKI